MPLCCPECNKVMKGQLDKPNYRIHKKCKQNPNFNEDARAEAEAKLKPILEKIVMVERLAEKKNDRAQTFVRSVKQYVQMNYRITKKQMEGLNKVYKRVSEDLFDKDE